MLRFVYDLCIYYNIVYDLSRCFLLLFEGNSQAPITFSCF